VEARDNNGRDYVARVAVARQSPALLENLR
jgi:hypothetical protein